MSLYPVADLQTHAGELAQRLISLRDFSSAAHELLATVRTLASDLVRRHTKKIVTLVEISRFTLTRAGINLYEFAYCRPEMREYKSVYFDILRALRERQADIDQDAVECRFRRLLNPLTTLLFIRRSDSEGESSSGAASPETGTPPPSALIYHSNDAHQRTSGRRLPPASSALMPPPPLLPHEYKAAARGRPRQRLDRPAAEVRLLARTRSPRRESGWLADADSEDNSDSDAEDNDDAPMVYVQRPSRPRQFGILCRGANARAYSAGPHHRSRRAGRV